MPRRRSIRAARRRWIWLTAKQFFCAEYLHHRVYPVPPRHCRFAECPWHSHCRTRTRVPRSHCLVAGGGCQYSGRQRRGQKQGRHCRLPSIRFLSRPGLSLLHQLDSWAGMTRNDTPYRPYCIPERPRLHRHFPSPTFTRVFLDIPGVLSKSYVRNSRGFLPAAFFACMRHRVWNLQRARFGD